MDADKTLQESLKESLDVESNDTKEVNDKQEVDTSTTEDELSQQFENDQEYKEEKEAVEKEQGRKMGLGQLKRFNKLYHDSKQAKRDLESSNSKISSR